MNIISKFKELKKYKYNFIKEENNILKLKKIKENSTNFLL